MKLAKRVPIELISKTKVNSKIVLAGWVQDVRDLGKITFVILRDRTGLAQLVIKGSANLTRESVIAVEGTVKSGKSKRFDREVVVSKLETLSKADPLPIEFLKEDIDTELDKRLDWRVIDLRNPKRLAIFKIRSEVERAIHEFFRVNEFIQVTTPKFSGAGAEGGATLFAFPYFGKKAYLNQSQQIYKQFMQSSGFERTYEIGPSFRAEKSHTVRHLTEFTHLDVEMSFIDSEEDVLKLQEKMVVHILKSVKKNCKKELELLDKTIDIPKLPFPRVAHAEAEKLLKIKGEIGTAEEKKLGFLVKKKYGTDLFFLNKFPAKLDGVKFYSMVDDGIGRVADLEYRGQEISTGTQREHRYSVLLKQIKAKGLKPKDFEFYTKAFKYGMPPHGGFGMGVERLVMFMLNLENIRECTLFPRDPERLSP